MCSYSFSSNFVVFRWLSCLMGRPPIIPEEAVDVDMPVDYVSADTY